MGLPELHLEQNFDIVSERYGAFGSLVLALHEACILTVFDGPYSP